jgi:hypothetical protein
MFVLIHSPLVGPFTWSLVEGELSQRGFSVTVPTLTDEEGDGGFWRQHAESVAETVAAAPAVSTPILVAHSGAGPLLPAIRQIAALPVAAYAFVDAGIPRYGASRLDLLDGEDPESAKQLRELLAAGRRFPEWTDEQIQPLVPNSELRRRLLAELKPRGAGFWKEPIPVFAGWPDAPCVYLQLSPFYDQPAAEARRRGWASETLEGNHFQMLLDPIAVTEALLRLTKDARAPQRHDSDG